MRGAAVRALAIVAMASCAGPPSSATQSAAPAGLSERVAASLDAARSHENHPWRDIAPLNDDGTANAYIEIPRGESTKWEFRIDLNRREVDRVIPPELGGYPINYGFLPQTISYDGDPADVLVLGPALEGGSIHRGAIVGFMEMIDTGDVDSKVVISPLDGSGRATHRLEDADRERLTRFFDTYKAHDGKVTKVTGWRDAAAALAFLRATAGFFTSAKR